MQEANYDKITSNYLAEAQRRETFRLAISSKRLFLDFDDSDAAFSSTLIKYSGAGKTMSDNDLSPSNATSLVSLLAMPQKELNSFFL